MVLDAGFDSAHNHHLLREDYGILSTIPPEHGRPPKDPNTLPRDRWRRLMKSRFRKGRPRIYGKRSQVETVFSMLKRNLGSALRARTELGRRRDMLLRVLTHNIALVLLWVFYRAGRRHYAEFLTDLTFPQLFSQGVNQGDVKMWDILGHFGRVEERRAYG